MDVLALTEQLIAIPSVTGDEAAVTEFIEGVCTELGFSCERQHVAENRWNLFVNWSDHVRVGFCTHTDTVPGDASAHADGTYIYGRGACDTKGIIASMIAAGHALMKSGHRPAYVFVVGEETDSVGAKSAAQSGKSADFIIVGEPTGNLLAAAHKGVLSYSLECTGVPAHSAYPDRGNSAIHALLDIIHDLRAGEWGADPILGPSTLNIGLLSGGTAPNVLAGRASCTIVHRIVDSLAERKQQVLRIVGGRADVRFKAENDPQTMFIPAGFESTGVSFGTDIPYVRSIGTPLLVGPGSIHDAHTEHERISIDELHTAVDMYAMLYTTLLGSAHERK